MIRSGLCHGPGCQEKITEKSESEDFCSQACQARWQAAYVGVKPDPALVGVPMVWRRVAGTGPCAPPLRPATPERIEALRLEYPLGRHIQLTGGEYEVTESEPGRAVLTPVEDVPEAAWRHDADGSRWLETYRNGVEYVQMRDGIDWMHAPLPARRHDCTPQLRGWMSREKVYRCACGSLSFDGEYWMERNSRRKDEAAELPKPIRRAWWKPNTWRRNG